MIMTMKSMRRFVVLFTVRNQLWCPPCSTSRHLRCSPLLMIFISACFSPFFLFSLLVGFSWLLSCHKWDRNINKSRHVICLSVSLPLFSSPHLSDQLSPVFLPSPGKKHSPLLQKKKNTKRGRSYLSCWLRWVKYSDRLPVSVPVRSQREYKPTQRDSATVCLYGMTSSPWSKTLTNGPPTPSPTSPTVSPTSVIKKRQKLILQPFRSECCVWDSVWMMMVL